MGKLEIDQRQEKAQFYQSILQDISDFQNLEIINISKSIILFNIRSGNITGCQIAFLANFLSLRVPATKFVYTYTQ